MMPLFYFYFAIVLLKLSMALIKNVNYYRLKINFLQNCNESIKCKLTQNIPILDLNLKRKNIKKPE